MAGAVEMCSGLGACRKKLEGTMCPSYMATREEAHSTRGRANVLRMAIGGRLGEVGLGDQGVYDVLDLCLECRACKAECPVGVDVARFKSEFLADYWSRHGTSLQARMLGSAHEVAKWGSRFSTILNSTLGSGLVRTLNERVLGIDRRRTLPRWSGRPFASRVRERGTGDVLIFNDTFTNYYDAEIGTAALNVLSRAGIKAGIAPNGCCGRPLISKGLLARARRRAAENVARLYSLAERGKTIVFLEPSCLSAVREDAPALLRGEDQRKANAIARACVLFEDFLNSELAAGHARLELNDHKRDVLLHGHCHQKAMGLLPSAKALLARVPGVAVIDPDAGCCGMAGSFGYTVDHYEVSRAIAERRLLPAIRDAKPGTTVVAAGFSCRHQIADFAGVKAVHPAVFLASLLTGPE
jgi:Fe-S oxidoreductase